MGLFFVLLSAFLTIALSFQLNSLATNILGGLIIAGGFILIFLWIDSTVLIARRSDPLFRDTLRWSKLRYLFWLATIGGAVGAITTAIDSGLSTIAPYGGALFFGAIALLISGRRSGDSTLRRHLEWTGLCVFLLWLASQAQDPLFRVITDPYLVQLLIYPLVAAGAYSLYRSAKSLVPLGHIMLDEGVTHSPAAASPSVPTRQAGSNRRNSEL